MPFAEVSVMDQRRRVAERVLCDGLSISSAAREAGISRPTAYLWVKRAREAGIAYVEEKSRAAHVSPNATPAHIVEQLIHGKMERPFWGAKKIVRKLWNEEPPLCVRTADRILKKHGLVRTRRPQEEMQRFEREACNELWQVDFKGLGEKPWPYHLLSVLDDKSRFCLALLPVPGPDSKSVFGAFWEVFGEYGLPEQILSDNGDCFNSVRSSGGPTPFQAKLWLLGISTTHGRPRHPQTQGKVERFNGTLQLEMGHELIKPSAEAARKVFGRFKEDYNWQRPHEALQMKVPGSIYSPSARKRPDRIPEHVPSGLGAWRKVHSNGYFSYKSRNYLAGKGLSGEHVEIREEDNGLGLYFANRRFAQVCPKV